MEITRNAINCKIKLKIKWTKYCVLSANGNYNVNDNDNANNIVFTIKDTELYVPVVTLSAKEKQKLSTILSKGFERSVYWNKYKTKSDNKDTVNESAITHKISETNSSFHVKKRTTGKVSFLFSKSFLPVLTKLLFWQGDWALGYHSMKFRHFPNIS